MDLLDLLCKGYILLTDLDLHFEIWSFFGAITCLRKSHMNSLVFQEGDAVLFSNMIFHINLFSHLIP